MPRGDTLDVPTSTYPSFCETRSDWCCRGSRRSGRATRRASPNANWSTAARISVPRPIALIGLAEPRAGAYLAGLAEPLGLERLRSDGRAVGERDQVERPPVGPPLRRRGVVEGDEPVFELGLVCPVGPRHLERHLVGWVDPSARHPRELPQLGDGREPQIEPRRPEAKPRQRVRPAEQQLPRADDVEAELLVEQCAASPRPAPRGRRCRSSAAASSATACTRARPSPRPRAAGSVFTSSIWATPPASRSSQ